MTSQLNGCPHFIGILFNSFFVKLIVACKLCVIFAREDDDSYVQAMITRLMNYMDLTVSCPKSAVKLNHSLTFVVVSIICVSCVNFWPNWTVKIKDNFHLIFVPWAHILFLNGSLPGKSLLLVWFRIPPLKHAELCITGHWVIKCLIKILNRR